MPASYSSNQAPSPDQYLGKTIAILNTAYGSENCVTIPFTVPNPDLTQQYRFLLDFAATPTCVQPGTKYIVDILSTAPVFVINPDFNTTYTNVAISGNLKTNDVIPTGSVYQTTPVLLSSPAGSLPVLTATGNGTYNFISATEGIYSYDVTVSYPNESNSTRRSKLTITVLKTGMGLNKPVANADLVSTLINTPVNINSLANDAAGNYNNALVPATITITGAPSHGTASADPVTGNILYTPAAWFTGKDTLTYSICDNQDPAQCASAVQIITVISSVANNTTAAADDYKFVYYNTPGSGNVLTNDTDPQGNAQTVNTQNIIVPGKGTLVLNANGSYIFTPVTGFWGPVNIAYTVCDNGAPSACASATLFITVRQAQPIILPDVNTTKKNIRVSENVYSNDTIPSGCLYGTSPTLISGPGGTVSLVMTGAGVYNFLSNTPGIYKYSVPVCMTSVPTCAASLLTITVLRASAYNDLPDESTERNSGAKATVSASTYTAYKIGIYPNPVSNELNINLAPSLQSVMTGVLYDATGRRLLQVQLRSGNNKINVSNLAKGIYTLSLRNSTVTENTQILIR